MASRIQPPKLSETAVLVGKGPSLDYAPWDFLLGETDCFVWVNESWRCGVSWGLPITAVVGQDKEALEDFAEVPPETIVMTQQNQSYAFPPRFQFREPWFQFPDHMGQAISPLGYKTGPNAVCALALCGVKRLHLVGFDSCVWEKGHFFDETKPFYARSVLDIGWKHTVNDAPDARAHYHSIAMEMHEALEITGMEHTFYRIRCESVQQVSE